MNAERFIAYFLVYLLLFLKGVFGKSCKQCKYLAVRVFNADSTFRFLLSYLPQCGRYSLRMVLEKPPVIL